MAILLIAEHDENGLKEATARALSAARQIDSQVDILVAGENCATIARQAAALEGVRKVLLAEAPVLAHQMAGPMTSLIMPLMETHDALAAPATSMGRDIAPRIAALLDVMQISDVVTVQSPDTFVRPIYAGNAMQTVRSREAKKVLTIRTTAFPAAGEGAQAAPVETIAAPAAASGARFESQQLNTSERPELTSARIVVSGGRGMGSKEAFAMLEDLAAKLGAAVGASRAAVDAGFVPNDLQVGQTGKIVAPELYMAFGISGAIQHLAGMKDSRVIVAINKDEEAPIFQVADYGLVADLFKVLPELIEKL